MKGGSAILGGLLFGTVVATATTTAGTVEATVASAASEVGTLGGVLRPLAAGQAVVVDLVDIAGAAAAGP
nr:hypothetical protein [Acidimicrobiia bacterium]